MPEIIEVPNTSLGVCSALQILVQCRYFVRVQKRFISLARATVVILREVFYIANRSIQFVRAI